MTTCTGFLRSAFRASALASALGLAGCPFALSDDFEIVDDADAGDAASAATRDAGRPPPPPSAGTGGSGGVNRSNSGAGAGGGTAGAAPAVPHDAGVAHSDTGAPNAFVCGSKPLAPGGPCPPECTGGCLLGLCTIRCAGDEACAEKKLHCPAGFACKIDCLTPGACAKTEVRCPEQYGCDVACAAAGSCKGLSVKCASGTCDILCGLNDACEDSELACGRGACRATCPVGGKASKLDCKQACACSRSGCG